jgi:hypothetical protein
MSPWITSKIFTNGQYSWCWQTESLINLIINIPHTILTIMNVACAIFITWTLYSKMQRNNFSREKVMKYRRLSKSILIIIPIFGVHFIIFEWVPYFRSASDDSPIEIPIIYIEVMFNWFQVCIF